MRDVGREASDRALNRIAAARVIARSHRMDARQGGVSRGGKGLWIHPLGSSHTSMRALVFCTFRLAPIYFLEDVHKDA